ncbi:MAG: DUF4240 domain-containing protein [Paracoccaceae bacterium]
MSLEEFWKVIEMSRATKSYDGQIESLTEILEGMSDEKLTKFVECYDRARDAAFSYKLWFVAYIVNGGCSDDGFYNFLDWLIAKGQRAHHRVSRNPLWVLFYLYRRPPNGYELEEFGQVPRDVYFDRFGRFAEYYALASTVNSPNEGQKNE